MRRMAPLPPSLSLLWYGTNAYVHPAAVCYFCISILDYALIHQGVQLVVCTLEAVVLFFESIGRREQAVLLIFCCCGTRQPGRRLVVAVPCCGPN